MQQGEIMNEGCSSKNLRNRTLSPGTFIAQEQTTRFFTCLLTYALHRYLSRGLALVFKYFLRAIRPPPYPDLERVEENR
jgi:hypothetical protein